jgi:hypothetical protein
MPSLTSNNDMTFSSRAVGLTSHDDLQNVRKPRICMLTTRGFALNAFRCGFYEGEDVLLAIDDVDLIVLEPKKAYELRQLVHERIIWHDFTGTMITTNLTMQPVNLTKEYDLFVAYLPFLQDIIHIPAIRCRKDRCKTSICWINELWIRDVNNPKFETWLSALDQFDHIASGLNLTAKVLGERLKRPCQFVPAGIDTLRFSPYPEPPPRVIDIYNMGRACPELHANFLDIATKQKKFYVYDTFNASNAQVKDYRQHRDMLANTAKRAQYFVVLPAQKPIPNQAADQIEVGARYFEAAAAGAILLGQAPDCEAFHDMFDWLDSVIEIQPDGSDALEILASLAAQPDRLLAISRRNTREALLRHDWLYRWKQIFNITGLKPTQRLARRENKLKAMAQINTAS